MSNLNTMVDLGREERSPRAERRMVEECPEVNCEAGKTMKDLPGQ